MIYQVLNIVYNKTISQAEITRVAQAEKKTRILLRITRRGQRLRVKTEPTLKTLVTRTENRVRVCGESIF